MQRVFALLLVLTALIFTASCGGGDGSDDPQDLGTDQTADSKDVTLDMGMPDVAPELTEDVPGIDFAPADEKTEPDVEDAEETAQPELVEDVVDLSQPEEVVDLQPEQDIAPPEPTEVGKGCMKDSDCDTNGGCFLGFCTAYCKSAGTPIVGVCENSDPDSDWGAVFGCPEDMDLCMPGAVTDVPLKCSVDLDCANIELAGFVCAGSFPAEDWDVDGRCIPFGDRKPVGAPCDSDDAECASLYCLYPPDSGEMDGTCASYCSADVACPPGMECAHSPVYDEDDIVGFAALCVPFDGSLKPCESTADCKVGKEHCGALLSPGSEEPQFLCMKSDNAQGAWPGDSCDSAEDCFGPYCIFEDWSDKLDSYCTQGCESNEDCPSDMECRPMHVQPLAGILPDSPYTMNICVRVEEGSPCFMGEEDGCEFDWSFCEALPGGFWVGQCVDGDCPPDCEGKACRDDDGCDGECLEPCLAGGAGCLDSAECLSGICVDGVCCDAICDGVCESCAIPELLGECSPFAMGADPEEECEICNACDGASACAPIEGGQDPEDVCGQCAQCAGLGACAPIIAGEDPFMECGTCTMCDGEGGCAAVAYGEDPKEDCEETDPILCQTTGICNGEGQCEFWLAETPCSEPACELTTFVPMATCDGFGLCVQKPGEPCAPYQCDTENVVCATTCDSSDACAFGNWCLDGVCQELPQCPPMQTKLICNTTLPGTSLGLNNTWNDYNSCVGGVLYEGPERIYNVKMTSDTLLTVTLSDIEHDSALMLLEAACAPDLACSQFADSYPAGGEESLTFTVKKDVQYHLAVDGFEEADSGNFMITTECCQLQCAEENACGDDGCGGSCGSCDDSEVCYEGQCAICADDPGVEPNDSCDDITAVLQPGEHDGLLLCPDADIDWYAMEVEAGEELSVLMEFDTELYNLDLALYGPHNCSSFVADSTTEEDEEMVQVLAMEAGTYYLLVYSPNWDQTGYTLSVSKTPPECTADDDCPGAQVCGLFECQLPPPPCEVELELNCLDFVDGDSTGGENSFEQYTTCTESLYQAPDAAYSVTMDSETVVTVTLLGQEFQGALGVLEQYCASDWACSAFSTGDAPGVVVQTVFRAAPDVPYYLLVEGVSPEDSGAFSLTVDCCTPQCEGKECGADGCGMDCGECLGEQDVCEEGLCVCVPTCDGVECGSDGCGGVCGDCLELYGQQFVCEEGLCACVPDCEGKVCGDDGCGGSCGECEGELDACVEGVCECQPACEGIECGEDGCEGVCGDCLELYGDQHICEEGLCVCVPDCEGMVCGDDGCGGSCGECEGPQDECIEGACECQPACEGKSCGDDGCSSICGECSLIEECVDFKCDCIDDAGLEPNNLCSVATPVSPATYPNMAICQGGDQDWYSIELQAGQTLSVNILFDHEIGDLDLYLFKQGNCVGYKTSSSSSTSNESISWTSQTLSTYLIRVNGFSPAVFNAYVMEIIVN